MNKNYVKYSLTYVALASFLLVGKGYATTVVVEKKNVAEVSTTQLPSYKPRNDYGSFSIRMDKQTNLTEREFLATATTFFELNETNSFRLLKSYTDLLGKQHNTYQHYVGQYAVEGQMFIVHLDQTGRVISVNGTIIDIENKKSSYSLRNNVNRKPVITQEKALNIAYQANKVTDNKQSKYPVETVFVRSTKENGVFLLAHKVRVDEFSSVQMMSKKVFVDVEKGDIVNEISLLAHANVRGTGDGFYRNDLPLDLTLEEGKYKLIDAERGIVIFDGTKNENAWEFYTKQGVVYESDTPIFAPSPSNDIHWGLARAYDYYLQVHRRNSYDGYGGKITAYYNPVILDGDSTGFPNNAASVPPPYDFLFFGRGSGNLNPLTALDIVGHEFTHSVVEYNGVGGLEYQGESGALNEGFADIFATSIEFFTVDDADWLIGKGTIVNGIDSFQRNMQNPKVKRHPNTYQGKFWIDPESQYDYGGVHNNSSVLNYWYYLLAEGGSGMTDPIKNTQNEVITPAKEYVVSGIGIQKAEKIAYHALDTQLGRNSQYIDAVEGTLTAAIDLFGEESEEYFAVYDAWYAVGLLESPRENMGIEDFELTEEVFSMYPNPVSNGELTVLIKEEQGTVSFYNMAGQKVTPDFTVEKGENKIRIPQLKTGNYIVFFESKTRKVSTKIVVK